MRKVRTKVGDSEIPRSKLKKLRIATRARDPKAAKDLLARSLSFGHRRLSLRRYFVALFLNAQGVGEYEKELRVIVGQMNDRDIQQIARNIANEFGVNSEQLMEAGRNLGIDLSQNGDAQEESQ